MAQKRKRVSVSPAKSGKDDGLGAFVYGTLAVVALMFFLIANANKESTRSTAEDSTPAYTSTATASLFNPSGPPASVQTVSLEQPSALKPLPSETPLAAERAGPSLVGQKRKVSGRKVPLRSEAIVGSVLVDRLNSGQVVTVTEERDQWVRVRVSSTLREGWIPTKRLGAEAGAELEIESPKIAPVLAAAVIIKRLIADSLANYDGSCPCPYNSDRAGRSCGRRSAHSRPGGAAPLCYASDVTPDMITAYRETHSSEDMR